MNVVAHQTDIKRKQLPLFVYISNEIETSLPN